MVRPHAAGPVLLINNITKKEGMVPDGAAEMQLYALSGIEKEYMLAKSKIKNVGIHASKAAVTDMLRAMHHTGLCSPAAAINPEATAMHQGADPCDR